MDMPRPSYVCPMHPDVTSDGPARCSKCGMALVPAGGDVTSAVAHAEEANHEKPSWRSYLPLIVVGLMISGASSVVSLCGPFTLTVFAFDWMTGFFLVFSGFKLMDLEGFAHGYATYDLLARRWSGYGYVYPFIELAFGLLMLAGVHAAGLLWAEFGVMTFSGVGVALKVSRREPFRCACLGTFLKVPLTTVTLIEDFGMASLALALLLA